jgi:hypothetical protein
VKLLVVLVIAGLGLWFVGSRIVDRGKDVDAIAQSSKDKINSVAGVLREATENAQTQGSHDETSWQGKVNTLCSRTSASLDSMGTPRTADEIATYLDQALPMVRSLHRRLGSFPPPAELADRASTAARALLTQEDMLVRVRTAARAGDSARMLNQIKLLRSLARTENPNLVKLGLTDCRLPSWGLPL